MRIKKKWGDRIYIEWVDAYSEDGWKFYKDMMEITDTVFCYTNGWYVGESKDFLVICCTKGKNIKREMMGKLVIPKKWIRKVK